MFKKGLCVKEAVHVAQLVIKKTVKTVKTAKYQIYF